MLAGVILLGEGPAGSHWLSEKGGGKGSRFSSVGGGVGVRLVREFSYLGTSPGENQSDCLHFIARSHAVREKPCSVRG